MTHTESSALTTFKLTYHTIRSVTSPEDQDAGRKRYCGVASAEHLFELTTDENVRGYLGRDNDDKKRKSTIVNLAIRRTVDENRDQFPLLNTGVVIVARQARVDDTTRVAVLKGASIINGAQTMGVLRDYFRDNDHDNGFPSVNFELVVTDDEQLIADISIARNFQNRVADLSIYGREGLFNELESAMQEHDDEVRLRKSETDFGLDLIDTEKLVQVLTAIAPPTVPLPSVDAKRSKTPETQYRVYAYRHRSRCLKDFAKVMDDQEGVEWELARQYFLGIAHDAWKVYGKMRAAPEFSSLHKVAKEGEGKNRQVASDGVPDGIVFPMLSALSRFVKRTKSGDWKLDIPKAFPWKALYRQAIVQHKEVAKHNPQTMGKTAGCYIALHGGLDMFFARDESQD